MGGFITSLQGEALLLGRRRPFNNSQKGSGEGGAAKSQSYTKITPRRGEMFYRTRAAWGELKNAKLMKRGGL